MFIKVEPAEFFMFRVIMIFDMDKPHSEDQEARDYLRDHELEPRYQRIGDFEGNNSEFMQFGGCYLGKHLGEISQIQRHHLELELLTSEIGRLLREPGQTVTIPDNCWEYAVGELVQTFHQDASFQVAKTGDLEVVLDGITVRKTALSLMLGTRED